MAGVQNYSIKGDRALSSGDEDKLGFREVAKQIATSLVDRASEDGLVIGVEGAWGSGKSSRLFLIGEELGKLPEDRGSAANRYQFPAVVDRQSRRPDHQPVRRALQAA
jgi:KAP family P-loop domain